MEQQLQSVSQTVRQTDRQISSGLILFMNGRKTIKIHIWVVPEGDETEGVRQKQHPPHPQHF